MQYCSLPVAWAARVGLEPLLDKHNPRLFSLISRESLSKKKIIKRKAEVRRLLKCITARAGRHQER
jgi:hypothetical protein